MIRIATDVVVVAADRAADGHSRSRAPDAVWDSTSLTCILLAAGLIPFGGSLPRATPPQP